MILAHVDCPPIIVQIRSFDVPLLVFLSGYLASKSHREIKYFDYLKKRILRLAVPTWIFLIIFFIIQTVAYTKPSFKDVILAITFQRDASMVGMVWVIWVYLVCAFSIPFVSRIGYNKRSILLITLLYVLFEILCCFTDIEANRALYITVLTIIPWGAVTFIGFNFGKISSQGKRLFVLVLTGVFVILAVYYASLNCSFVLTTEYKYPARAYYLCFAMPIVFILMSVFSSINLKRNRVIEFISGASLWIYLWHILALYFVKSIIENDELWLIQYIIILLISICITYVQNRVVLQLMKYRRMKFLKVFLG